MIRGAVEAVAQLGPVAVLVLAAWAVWAVAGLSPYTWAASVGAGMLAVSQWGWSGVAALDAVAVTAVLGYIADCLVDPRADCWWCKGSPKRRNSRSFFHLCLICGGSGQRRRWGSKVLARHRDAD